MRSIYPILGLVLTAVACSKPVDPVEQYAKNPIGCESKTSQWYAEMATTKAGQDELKKRAREYEMRGKYHGRLIEFDSLSKEEKTANIDKTLTCLREEKWSLEALAKVGITSLK